MAGCCSGEQCSYVECIVVAFRCLQGRFLLFALRIVRLPGPALAKAPGAAADVAPNGVSPPKLGAPPPPNGVPPPPPPKGGVAAEPPWPKGEDCAVAPPKEGLENELPPLPKGVWPGCVLVLGPPPKGVDVPKGVLVDWLLALKPELGNAL